MRDLLDVAQHPQRLGGHEIHRVGNRTDNVFRHGQTHGQITVAESLERAEQCDHRIVQLLVFNLGASETVDTFLQQFVERGAQAA